MNQEKNQRPVVGIIGGSGLEEVFDDFQPLYEFYPDTPFGYPSAPIMVGMLFGVCVAFLSRHGLGHILNPSEVPYRANVYALKMLGVKVVVATTSVGSLDPRLKPGDLAVASQFVDATCRCLRPGTFFEKGIVAHVPMANPVCPELTELLANILQECFQITVKVIEGPRFSTRGEARLNRQPEAGINAVGETAMPEATLLREARICAVYIVVVTDDDCRAGGVQVSAEVVSRKVAERRKDVAVVMEYFLKSLPSERMCACGRALDEAIMTKPPERVTDEVRRRLFHIIGDILPPSQQHTIGPVEAMALAIGIARPRVEEETKKEPTTARVVRPQLVEDMQQ